jgi:two-component system phosphate regulon sensor histidine kinase PhoR
VQRRSFLWQIFPPVLLIVALSLVASGLFASRTLSSFYIERTRADLEVRTILVGESTAGRLAPARRAALQQLIEEIGERTETRFTVTIADGTVVADSDANPTEMDNHANRPEIHAALSREIGSSQRYSQTISADLMYVAVPLLGDDGELTGVVRAAVPLTAIDAALASIYMRTTLAGVVIVSLAAIVVLWLSRRINRPLVQLRDTAERISSGDLNARPPDFRSAEISELSRAMIRMSTQLADRIDALSRHRGEQQRVLSSMVEGVLAIDRAANVTTLNDAAADILGVARGPSMLGRSMEEVVRNPDILRFISEVLDAGSPIEKEIVMHGVHLRSLHARGAPILSPAEESLGVVVVLDDVTHLEHLESVRKDFVANVSHELKTPITSIKASVETMLDGAVDDEATAKRFLQIIARQSDRLAAIVEDLLSLSRIEQEAAGVGVQLLPGDLRSVVTIALDACRVTADAKKVRLSSQCDADIELPMSSTLLEQALVNLVDNAIKYSEPGGTVDVDVARREGSVKIAVRDTGCGIEASHLDRLFERFYRVDKARSRSLGGTGLGLSIVKHAAQAHGGSVHVESEIGIGSTFSIDLPMH